MFSVVAGLVQMNDMNGMLWPGFYMLAHSSSDVLPEGSVTTLTSPVRRGLSHTECVQFWYHTGGEKPGKRTLSHKCVYIYSFIGENSIWVPTQARWMSM